MYHGKRVHRKTKAPRNYKGKRLSANAKKQSYKALVMLLAVSSITVAVRPTVAFLVDNKTLENNFSYAWVSSEIKETFEEGEKSDVTIANTGDIDTYIRAAIVVTWQDEGGNVYGPVQPVEYTTTQVGEYTMDLNLAADGWVLANGYYYYTAPVGPGDETAILIESCYLEDDVTPPTDNDGNGYGLVVDILADTIQANPTTAVYEAWGVTVDSDGNLEVDE